MRVLVFIGHYLPGYRAGGPIRTIANLVERLGDEFDFRIVCADRDLGDTHAYPSVPVDCWTRVGKAQVYYLPPSKQTVLAYARLMRETPHDVVYLNSAFDPRFSLRPLLARKLLGAAARPFVLAPRGEFGKGALALKAFKKRSFLSLAKVTGLYSGALWQASSEHEAEDIGRVIGATAELSCVATDLANWHVAPDLTLAPADGHRAPVRHPRGITLLFLSRLVPKKNLAFALLALRYVTAKVSLSVVGPKEDAIYWSECERVMADLPGNVTVQYRGLVRPDEVPTIMAEHDLFFLPTRNENFGHVISEALVAGTPVLISDQTPWRGLEAHGAGWDLPLDSPGAFAAVIDDYARRPIEARNKLRESAMHFARARLEDPAALEANRQLFYRAVATAGAPEAARAVQKR